MIELRHTCPQVLLAIGALYLLFIEHIVYSILH
jgi:hypothetical protein